MADKEDALAISEESKAMLEDHVKKGKARKFILITKGASIKTLIVFKKGPYGPKIMAAKKEGFKGEATCGVVTGKGVNVEFQLPGSNDVASSMKTDGVHDAEPCKIAKLRKFFTEEANLKLKPEFNIITELSAVASVDENDDDGESTEPNESPAPTESSTPNESSPPTEVDEQLKGKLVEALKRLTPKIQEAVVAQPQRKQEILGPIASIKEHIQAGRFDQAKEGLLLYPPLLKEILGSPQPSTSTQSTESSSDLESEWNTLLKDLTPRLKKVIGEKLGDFARVGGLYKEAQGKKANDQAAAVEILKQCDSLIGEILTPASTDEEQQLASMWSDVSSEFASQRKRISETLPNRLAEYNDLVQKAEQLASSGQYQEAIQLAMQAGEIDGLARSASITESVKDSIPEGIVAERKKFLLSRWQEAIRMSRVQVEQIGSAVSAHVPDENPSELVQAINAGLDDFCSDLNDAITDAQTATSANLTGLDRALNVIKDYRSKIKTDELIQHLESAQGALGVGIKVQDALLSALDEIENKLAG